MRLSRLQARWQRVDGSALMSAAVAAAVLGIMVVSYLAWVTNEYRLCKRSHRWAQALHLAEAGAEVGCAELNFPYTQGGSAFQTINGWTSAGGNSYRKSVSNFVDASGAVVGGYSVLVSSVNSTYPTIQSVGTFTAAQGNAGARAIQVWLKKRGPSYGIATRSDIDMSGAYVDSFDSSDPTKSTGGLYDFAKRQANASLKSAVTVGDAIKTSGTDVYGTMATGPGGTVNLKSSVGNTLNAAQRATTVADAEAKGWITHDFTMDFPDVQLPSELTTAPNVGSVNGYTFSSGDWQVGELKSSDSTKPIVIQGNVRIYATLAVTVSGSGFIKIMPTSSLEVYASQKITISGAGIANQTGYAANNTWYSLPTSTEMKISGSSTWIGTVYGPQLKLELSGGSGFSGAFVSDTFKTSGGAVVHYDEALGGGSGSRGYSVTAWQELRYVGGSWVP